MSVFLYRHKNNLFHRLDPRVKVAALLWLFVTVALTQELVTVSVLLAVVLGLFLVTDSVANLARMALLFVIVTAMTFLLWAVFYRDAGGASSGRTVYAAVMSLRFLCMLLSGLLFLSVTSIEDFANGLMLLGVPYSVAFTVSLSFRLVNVFVSTGFLIVEAQRVRGNDATRGNIVRRMKAYAPLLVPLILNGIKKAETLNLALESKGFSPKNQVDVAGRYTMTAATATSLALLVASLGAFVGYRLLS